MGVSDWGRSNRLRVDLRGWLVITEAHENWMTQTAVLRAFGELDLGDELRLDPEALSTGPAPGRALRHGLVQWTGTAPQRAESLQQVLESCFVEASADVSGVAQPGVVVVGAKNERAQRFGATAGAGGIADDHELV